MTHYQINSLACIQVSEHFTLAEVLHTDHPLRQSGLSADKLVNVQLMAAVMENVRKLLQRPIVVNSWFRSPALNIAVGGVPTSAHLQGLAVDFEVSSTEFRRVAQSKSFTYDQAIYYASRSFMHLGIRLDENDFFDNRQQIIYKK